MNSNDPEGDVEKQKDGTDASEDPDNQLLEDASSDDDEEERIDPGVWWFASTMCPLLAATFGPIATGFSICALVYRWRDYVPTGTGGSDLKPIPDPHWLIAINAASLALAVIGNFALLLCMSHRLRFQIAQPITIIGFLTAGVLLVADVVALRALPDNGITEPYARLGTNHILTSAFYYAIFAAGNYILIGLLLCLTAYGAHKGFYSKDFSLTPSQRTMMLQTISFVAYLLLGALVFSVIEDWRYLDAVYWADVTLLTIGFGDISPQTNVGRGLLFPFAIGGVLIVGLVIGSIRSLVLERGEEKLAARIVEGRREAATHNVDERKHTIKVSWFAHAEFIADKSMTAAQRREQEFIVMRKVQAAADAERRYILLAASASVALLLWFVGAVIFMATEHASGWTYLDSLYFAFVALLTIGYGDFAPKSSAGRAFFVFWSLLSIPALTILISYMGDTIVKWVSDLTNFVASVTILPGEDGFRRSAQEIAKKMQTKAKKFTPPGLLGSFRPQATQTSSGSEHGNDLLERIASRLERHLERQEIELLHNYGMAGDEVERDIHFYLFILSRECRKMRNDLSSSPSKKYAWEDWEYYLRLMADADDFDHELGQKDVQVAACEQASNQSNASEQPYFHGRDDSSNRPSLTPAADRAVSSANLKRRHRSPLPRGQALESRLERDDHLHGWSWLSSRSPLMSGGSETEWILDRLSRALERELDRQRRGLKVKPPISIFDVTKLREGRVGPAEREDRQLLEREIENFQQVPQVSGSNSQNQVRIEKQEEWRQGT